MRAGTPRDDGLKRFPGAKIPFCSRQNSCGRSAPTGDSGYASRAAEGLVNAFVRLWSSSVMRESRLVFIRGREQTLKLLEGLEVVPLYRRLDEGLHAVIAWDKRWIDGLHRDASPARVLRFVAQPFSPASCPTVISDGVEEEASDGLVPVRTYRRVCETAEGQGEIGPVLGHGT